MIKTLFRSPITTIVLFVLAAALLIGGGIGAAQAAPRIQSNDYRAEVVLSNIETSITENGTIVEGDDTLLRQGFTSYASNAEKGLGWDAQNQAVTGFKLGTTYDEALAVRNVGTIDQYIRVTVNKYWVLTGTDGKPLADAQGKQVTLDPSLIDLHFIDGSSGDKGEGRWSIDEAASTPERTVLYYSEPIAPGADTNPFTDKLTVKSDVISQVTKQADGSLSFDYNGVQFRIKASVDAVQTHNPDPAMTSAWGRTNK